MAVNTSTSAYASHKNPINRLQEVFQQWKAPLPTYREAQGSYQEFGTEVTITLESASEALKFHAKGRTKKISKANAAQLALNYIAEHKPEMLEPPPLPVSGQLIVASYWSRCTNNYGSPSIKLAIRRLYHSPTYAYRRLMRV